MQFAAVMWTRYKERMHCDTEIQAYKPYESLDVTQNQHLTREATLKSVLLNIYSLVKIK